MRDIIISHPIVTTPVTADVGKFTARVSVFIGSKMCHAAVQTVHHSSCVAWSQRLWAIRVHVRRYMKYVLGLSSARLNRVVGTMRLEVGFFGAPRLASSDQVSI